MTLQQKNKKWRIVDVIFLLLLPFFSNAATPEESKEEILFYGAQYKMWHE